MAGQGQIYTYSDTVTTIRTLADYVNILDPQDTPCVSYFGTNNAGRFRIKNGPNHKYAWLLDTLKVRTATLAEALDTTETVVSVAAGQGVRFKPGDVWESDETGELLYVSSRSTDDVTVIRNWAAAMGGSQGTATVGVTDATTLSYLYSAREEGDESDAAHWTTPSEEYNYSQIFHHEIKVSGSEQDATTRYGITDYYKYQFMKAMGGLGGGKGVKGRAGDLMIDLENTFFKGQRVLRADGTAGAMGGLKTFVTTNTYDLNASLLEYDTLVNAIQDCWSAGGKPNVIICNAFNKRLINSWFAPAIQTDRTERTGGNLISKVETDFGILDIMLNRHCPASEVDIVQKEDVGWITLRSWREEMLAKTGDYKRSQIIGEFGFVVMNESAHAVITDTATS